ncbi:MAG: FMN-binding protein [Candidatus Aminicenantes bacterium]|nr:FMN-binding protein [Candidatus Aminicenantes bacterium]
MKKQALSILYMFLITLFFASLVSAVKFLNEAKIETNQIVKLQRVILKVLDIPVQDPISYDELRRLFTAQIKNIQVGQKILYIGYEQDGRTIRGYAVPVGGPGFWGPIEGLVGVSPDATKILGLAFTKHNETPGLGGRITEDWFSDQFKGLSLYPLEGSQNIFSFTAEGTQKSPNELDAITGASNTSSAVETFLNQDLDYFLKELWGSIKEKE